MLSSGVSPFSFVFFWPHRPEKFRAEPLQTSVNNRVSNFSMHENGKSRLQSKIFVAQYAKISWEPLLSFRVLGISEAFMPITVFLRFFCLTVPKNFVRNHLMFQKVSNVRYRKDL